LFRDSGATQMEQMAAIGVARELVPVCGSSLTDSEDGSQPSLEDGQ
jgi:hypothetical protein